nr:hypothetical protein [Tanacetum cinerariifolium]
MQQFWYTVITVEDEKDLIRFRIDQQDVDFSPDTFFTMLQLPQETVEKQFVTLREFLSFAEFLKHISYEVFVTIVTRVICNDLVYQVTQSSYKAVQYLQYVKMIINYVMATLPTSPKQLNEPYHNLQDDNLILMMFTTGNLMNTTVVRILEELLIEDIRKTKSYKMYDDDYIGIVVPMTQSSPVMSTQGIHRALSTPRKPKPKRNPQKKKEKVVGGVEPKENVTSVEKAIIFVEVKKMVEGEEEEDGGFVDSLFLSQEDPGTRLEPESHKESLKEKKYDDDDDDHISMMMH